MVGLSSGAAHATSYGPIFLKFTGIDGSAQQEAHKNWSEVQDVSWGVSSSGTGSSSSGGAVGKLTFQDVKWDQLVDQSIPPLFLAITSAKVIATATVDFTASCESRSCTYFEMSFKNPLLTSLDVGGSSGSGATANGAFSYTAVSMTYWGIKPNGSLGDPISASYDIKTGKGSASALASVFGLGTSGPGAAVPEPGTALLAMTGLLGLAATGRRRGPRPG
jgi:type VI secretion system secreted protein Hcp